MIRDDSQTSRTARQGAADVSSAELLPVCSAGKMPAAPCGSWAAEWRKVNRNGIRKETASTAHISLGRTKFSVKAG
jgi:hypothetical protein